MTDYMLARGWLSPAERVDLVRYASYASLMMDNPIIVNIGIEYGASLHCLRAGSPTGTIVGIDINPNKLEGNPNCDIIMGDSNDPDTVALVREPIGLLFIDGGHDFVTVEQDILLWSPKVVAGGLMVFHDYSSLDMHAGVKGAVDTWAEHIEGVWEFKRQQDTLRGYLKR